MVCIYQKWRVWAGRARVAELGGGLSGGEKSVSFRILFMDGLTYIERHVDDADSVTGKGCIRLRAECMNVTYIAT